MSFWLLVAIVVAGAAVVAIARLSKRVARLEYPQAGATSSVEMLDAALDASDDGEPGDDEAVEEEMKLALLIQAQARYARNFATDMLDPSMREEDRAYGRQKYADAKTKYLIQAQSIRDEFYRGLASHAVIDLMLAGGEHDHAKRLFDTIDPTIQDSIIATDPAAYRGLR